jgi:Ca-activated chloride channel family protein
MMPLEFAKPLWLLAGLVVTLATALLIYSTEKRALTRLKQFVSNDLIARLASSRSNRRVWVRHCVLLLALFLLFVSLARPQWGAVWQKSETRGIDIMIALDTSRSMLAEDISPNRLERSKLAILDLLETVRGDRVGLIAFAGNAFLQCPLTLDYQAFRQTLAALDTDSIPVGGTDVASAIEEADAYFEKTDNTRILILITDGEDLGADGVNRAQQSAEQGTRILTVGVGSPQGELIPIRTPDGQRDFLRDSEGNPVSTALDASTLMQIAEATGGVYAALGQTGSGLLDAYQFSLSQSEASERNELLQRIPLERFQWPLLAAFLLLILEPFISNRRRHGSNTSGAVLLALLFTAMFLLPNKAHASATEAAKAYKDGRYEESVSLYQDALLEEPDQPKLSYNLGVSAYHADDFTRAIDAFESVVRKDKGQLKTKAFYNLGNSRVAAGFGALEENPASSRDLWNAALLDYQNALALKPSYARATQNLAALKRTIANYTFRLETSADPLDGGTVSPPQDAFYKVPIPIEATAAEGWEFVEWQGESIDDPSASSTTIALESDQSIVARFAKVWELTVHSADPEAGTAGTSGTYRENEPVTVKAEANDYFAFSQWTVNGDAQIEDAKAAETQLQLTGDASLTANFVPAFKLSISIEPEIGGKAGPSGFFEEYSVVPIQAEPRDGFEWISWNGFGIKEPEQQQTSIALTSDRIAIAQMRRIWNLVIIPQPEEGGTVSGAGNHSIGSSVPIEASPNEGFVFERWEGPAVSNPQEASTSVTVTSSEHTLFAIFRKNDQDEQNEDQQNQDQQDQQDQEQEQNNDSSQSSSDDPSQQDSSQSDQQESSDSTEQEEQANEQEANEEEQNAEENGQQQPEEPADAEENAAPENEQQNGNPQQMAVQPLQMTREEARQLLNALSEDERFLPAGETNEKINSRNPNMEGKDW